MFSALPSNSDIARCSRHVSNVPQPDIADTAAIVFLHRSKQFQEEAAEHTAGRPPVT
jgi:hypothetical protein